MNKKNQRYCAAMLVCSGLPSGCGLWSNDSLDTRGAAGSGAASAAAGVGGGTAANVGNGAAGQAGDPFAAGGDGILPSGGPCRITVPPTSQIPRLLNRQYAAVMRDLLGISGLAVEGGNGEQKLTDLLVSDSDAQMTPAAWQVYQDLGEKIAQAVMSGPNKSKFISCDPAQAGCMDDTIKSFGRKAFRRPLTDDEVARFQKLGQTTPAPTPDELAETTLDAFLVSPSFLMLPELATDRPATGTQTGVLLLSSYEVATRLSMLIWGSIPDEELDKAADNDELQTKEQILAQAKRMLQNRDKAAPLVEAFHRRWLLVDDNSGRWGKIRHDLAIFPAYKESAVPTLQAELDAFFDDVAFRGGTFKDLFLSNVAFVNRDTAAIYGLDPAGYGADLKRVELDAKQRPGFLTRAAFLSSYSNYSVTNPFLRGAFIARNFLGIEIPPDPDTLRSIPDTGFKTNREYAEALTSQQPCKGCHEYFSPDGFALENYDAIGAWQTIDARGGAIDATATIQVGNGSAPTKVNSPLELMQLIAVNPSAKALYAQTWVSFAYGRAITPYDRCLIENLNSELQTDDYPVLGIPADLTQAEAFRARVRETP